MLSVFSLLLASCLMSWTAFNSFFQPLLTRFDSKFDMREAYCSSSNDVYKNSSSSTTEKEWLGNVPLSLRFSMTRCLTLFCRYFPVEPELGGTRRGFFPTKDKLQIHVEIKENLLKDLLYCIKLRDSGKLQTREDTCSQVNQYKNYRSQGRSQERFGRLAGWLGPWEGVRQDHR